MYFVLVRQRANTNPSKTVAAAVADHQFIAIDSKPNTKQWQAIVARVRKFGVAIIDCNIEQQAQYVATKIRDADIVGAYTVNVCSISDIQLF